MPTPLADVTPDRAAVLQLHEYMEPKKVKALKKKAQKLLGVKVVVLAGVNDLMVIRERRRAA